MAGATVLPSDYVAYWSSSEIDASGAWGFGFDYGYAYDYGSKSNTGYVVRAVRAF
jgi:hypothetical protein